MALINRKALMNCITPTVMRRSSIVALVVGTALVAINEGDIILAGGPVSIWKIVLTYIVPFLVSTYGAYSALAAQQDPNTQVE